MGAVSVSIHGGTVIVDREDARFLDGREWFVQRSASGLRYAVSKRQRLHRLIVSASEGQMVDHINGDGLDNRRENLRFCTHVQNMQNRKPSSARKSEYKGVSIRAGRPRPFQVRIKAFGERIHVGSFETEIEAAKAYDRAARVFHGKFARTNEALGLL